MKRSEIVDIIGHIIHDQRRHTELYTSDDIAENVLQTIEKAGMLPPERWRDKDWNEKGITYSDWLQLPSKVNEWESEND